MTVKKFELEEPVELGELRLAPTVELAGLAELTALADHDERVDALVRIAASIRDEDQVRDHVATLREQEAHGETGGTMLPKRR